MSDAPVRVREMDPADWPPVRDIFAEGLATGVAAFDAVPPDRDAWDAGHLSHCRLVAVGGDTVLGWAALSPVSDRCALTGVAEVSVYVAGAARGRGVGRRLLEALIECSEKHGIWTLQAGIFAENRASVELHLRCGFREVGRRERLGKLNGVWRDVLLLERRSGTVGV